MHTRRGAWRLTPTSSQGAHAGNSFDAAYGDEHRFKDSESHFIGGTMNLAIGGDYLSRPDPLRPAKASLPKHELAPPPRPKFLKGVWANGEPKVSGETLIESYGSRVAADGSR